VDRTVKSNVSLKLAEQHNIIAKRLPIQEFMPSRQTHILNVNTIIKIFCKYGEYAGDWKLALEASVPVRKQSNHKQPKALQKKTPPTENS
jgi:hypothetical protein